MRALILASALALSACGASTAVDPGAAPASALAPGDLRLFFDCLRENGHTVVAAHRGGPAPGFAENAISTFENTLRQTPALLEIDIASTSDDVLVLMHDDTVDRTTTGTGEVRSFTLDQLLALQLEDNDGRPVDARVPTLRETLDWAEGRAVLELDVKRGVSYEDVIAEVRAANAQNRVIFITYSDDAAVRVHRLAPELMLSVSIDDASDLDTLRERGIDLARVLAWTGITEPNEALNRALAERGVEAMFGTLGNPSRSWDGRFEREGDDRYDEFAAMGLQLIATDRPVEAGRDIDASDGVDGVAALQCVAD